MLRPGWRARWGRRVQQGRGGRKSGTSGDLTGEAKGSQTMGGVLTGLPVVELREWLVAWWLGRSTFDGSGRHQLERMRRAPLVAPSEQGSALCGMRSRRT